MAEKPIIILNLKAYRESEGEGAIELTKIASEVSLVSGARIIVAPPASMLSACTQFGIEIFAQHCDGNAPGAFTGSISAYSLKKAGIAGSLVNHSEKKMHHEDILKAVEGLRENKLVSVVCSKDIPESAQLSNFKPDYIAIEPPELIGSGISVSTAKPEIVTGAIDAVKANGDVPVICGAGISNAKDVKKSVELGVAGVLLASAYVKSKDPKKLLEDMASML